MSYVEIIVMVVWLYQGFWTTIDVFPRHCVFSEEVIVVWATKCALDEAVLVS